MRLNNPQCATARTLTLTLSLGKGEGESLLPASGERIKVRGCRMFQVIHEYVRLAIRVFLNASVQRPVRFVIPLAHRAQGVVESHRGGVLAREGVVNPFQPRPVDGRQTHGARLATGVDFRASEMITAKVVAGVADGDDFGMRRRVIAGSHLIAAAPDDTILFHHNGAKRAACSVPQGFPVKVGSPRR